MKRLIILSLFTGFLLFAAGRSALACSCIETGPPTEAFRKADLVFVGTATDISDSDSRVFGDEFNFRDRRTTFLIEDALKGVDKKTKEVDIYTSTQGTACGISFDLGEKVLVYAYGGNEEQKYYSTSICSRTRPVADREDEIAVLRSLAKGRLEPRIYGTVWELIRGIDPLKDSYEDRRRPQEGVGIVVSQVGGTRVFRTETDSDGRFRLVGMPRGTYRIRVKPPPQYKVGGDYWDEPTADERDEINNLTVKITDRDNPDEIWIETRIDGRIKGRVYGPGGRPVGKDVRVVLVSAGTAHEEPGDIDHVPAYTDEKGYYEFFGIPPGEYYLGINLDTRPNKEFPYPRLYYPSSGDIEGATPVLLGRGQKLSGYDLILPSKVRELEFRGTVVDEDGRPVANAFVEVYGLYNREWTEQDDYSMRSILQPTFEGRVETDANGWFTVRLLEGNRYRLNAFLRQKESPYKLLYEGEAVEVEAKDGFGPIRIEVKKQ